MALYLPPTVTARKSTTGALRRGRRAAPPTHGWSAGFGPSDDPHLTNVQGATFRAARRRLKRCLELYRDLLAATPECRRDFAEAIRWLDRAPEGEAWTWRVVGDGGDLTFWLLCDADAVARGCRPKA